MFLPYGNHPISFDPPAEAEILTSGIERAARAGEAIVREAMAAPIGSPRLEELARGKKRCTLIISDHTRPVPSRAILPPMLEALRKGNPDIEITLLVATGCHRLTTAAELTAKLGPEIAQRERIVVHDCDADNREIGVLPSGAPLVIDNLAADADLLVAEGFIEPHFFAGFSGGRKSVLPGVCDRATVLGNHCSRFIDNPCVRTGILQGNPIEADMAAAARMARLAFIVNVVIDEDHNVSAAFAGNFREAHRAGCSYLADRCAVTGSEADVVITTNGGAPLDQNIYQCVKGMTAAEAILRPGGVCILLGECADGVGGDVFCRDFAECESISALYDRILSTPQEKTPPDQWQSQILARILRDFTVIMVTKADLKETVEAMKMRFAFSLDEALRMAEEIVGAGYRLSVIPNGVSVIVKKK